MEVKARKFPGVRFSRDGARSSAAAGVEAKHSDCARNSVQTNVVDPDARPKHQAARSYCALNSVANMFEIDAVLYEKIKKLGPMVSLKEVCHQINTHKGTPCQLEKFGMKHSKTMLEELLLQEEGLFVVRFHGHCVGWDAAKKEIIEPDPSFHKPNHGCQFEDVGHS